MRAVYLIVARYTRDHQSPSRQFLWMLEVQMRAFISETVAFSAEEEMDHQIEEETWDQVQ